MYILGGYVNLTKLPLFISGKIISQKYQINKAIIQKLGNQRKWKSYTICGIIFMDEFKQQSS